MGELSQTSEPSHTGVRLNRPPEASERATAALNGLGKADSDATAAKTTTESVLAVSSRLIAVTDAARAR